MPLRDHFHSPLRDQHRWPGFHAVWTVNMVRHLNERWLPSRYRADAEVTVATQVEVDIATFEEESTAGSGGNTGNGVATAVWSPPRPVQSCAINLPAQDTFEVRIYDIQRHSRLVAVIELVSPGNKDRPDAWRAFAIKCASCLAQRVAVVVVDVVTERRDSLHTELLRLLQVSELTPSLEQAPLYAVAYRTTKQNEAWRLDIWPETLTLGAVLPTMPLWLADNLAVPLELEPSYLETFQTLRIR
jgi:hypothetical protein